MTDASGATGLRERKKARTRDAIREKARRLFREQGYAATTVAQIAEAAEVSLSTLFRYFPAKADLVMGGHLDDVILRVFQSQPAHVRATEACRIALEAAFQGLSSGILDDVFGEEPLATAADVQLNVAGEFAGLVGMLTGFVAEREGRSPDDIEVRAYAGAAIGVTMAAWAEAASGRRGVEGTNLLDVGLRRLETGFPI